MRREVVLLLAAFTAAGCLPDKSKAVADCRIEADRFYQGYNAADVNNPRSRYILDCMTTKGYVFDISSDKCDSRHPLATQTTCYDSNNWLVWAIDQFRARGN